MRGRFRKAIRNHPKEELIMSIMNFMETVFSVYNESRDYAAAKMKEQGVVMDNVLHF